MPRIFKWPTTLRQVQNIATLGCALLLLMGSASSLGWQSVGNHIELERGWQEYLASSELLTPAPELPFETCFIDAARKTELPVTLLQAVARGESDFDARAVSKAGALGVMQVLWPGTARDLGLRSRTQAFDACTNIDAGARYLAQMLDRYNNNLHLALIAYNRGPANLDRLVRTNRVAAHSWYSNYVWDHLGFVLARQDVEVEHYETSKRLVFIRFTMPFRARDLVALLRQQAPTLRFDWFKNPTGDFAVALHYENSSQLKQGRAQLQRLGLLSRD